MPMIDIAAPEGTFPEPAEAALLERATACVLQWEKVTGIPYATANTGAFLNVLPRGRLTAGGKAASAVRIQVLTPAKSLTQEQRAGIAASLTDIVAELANTPGQREQTWVLFHEAVDGGWGIAGKALTNVELVDAVRASAIALRAGQAGR
ncbi:tautomerase family protein [Corallococcus terminator]|uniref:4-oxalocrotonate tautomerase n=1 Tax=Corallococcus terminator TaxID=2316733 RepID=A0A3A8J814_9BACT|nr:tautomerase family protein [Corallococcus terminator]RKG91937.1 4-oxalocrotonate tautomerase [Corallococcus terminator]